MARLSRLITTDYVVENLTDTEDGYENDLYASDSCAALIEADGETQFQISGLKEIIIDYVSLNEEWDEDGYSWSETVRSWQDVNWREVLLRVAKALDMEDTLAPELRQSVESQ
jgi:hypothetical protein